MEALHKLEDQIATLFKDLPKLPDNINEVIVKIQPILALVFGIIQLLAAWGLMSVAGWAERWSQYGSEINGYVGNAYAGLTPVNRAVIYGGIAILVIDAIILLVAVNPLQKRQKKGWDLLFLGVVLYFVYGIISLFMGPQGFGSLISTLVGTAISLYILFQIRNKYGSKNHKEKPTPHKK